MINKIAGSILIILIGTAYFFWDKSEKLSGIVLMLKDQVAALEASLDAEKEKNKIRVSNSVLRDAAKLTFAEVTNEFNYLYDKKHGSWAKHERITVLYEWDYTFSFGLDIKEGWNWCPVVVDEDMGIVQVNAPMIIQTNANKPGPKITKVINNAYWNENQEEANSVVFNYAEAVIKERAKNYLTQESILKTVEISLSSHLQSIMNSRHAISNPVSKVNINFVEVSECPESD